VAAEGAQEGEDVWRAESEEVGTESEEQPLLLPTSSCVAVGL